MSATTKSITVELTCDTFGCDARETITAATLAVVKAKATGWWFGRRRGERVECTRCRRRFLRRVADGIIDKDGYILDMARWEAGE